MSVTPDRTVTIVIMENSNGANRAPVYLSEDNPVLEAQYSQQLLVVRVDLPYYFTSLGEARRNPLPLLKAFDLKPSQLDSLLETPQWLAVEIEQLVFDETEKAAPGFDPSVVRTVFIDADLLKEADSLVVGALAPSLPNATFFRVHHRDDSPERLTPGPVCPNCHSTDKVTVAGNMYYCTRCGQQAPGTPPPPPTADMPEGPGPTQEKVDPPPTVDVPDEPEDHKLCGHCGSKMPLQDDQYVCPSCGRTKPRTGPETVTE